MRYAPLLYLTDMLTGQRDGEKYWHANRTRVTATSHGPTAPSV